MALHRIQEAIPQRIAAGSHAQWMWYGWVGLMDRHCAHGRNRMLGVVPEHAVGG
jgi:hypothetical protein